MILEYFNDYRDLGLKVIPIEWDVKTKQPVSHTEWSKSQDYRVSKKHNGIMIQTHNEYACFDFDHKNASRQTIYQEWWEILMTQFPDIGSKVYIEKTRNAGYHVWFYYDKLQGKQSLADSPTGAEVIAIYAKGPLVYTFPSPGYQEVHGTMIDIKPLTEQEFEAMVATAEFFNEYKPKYDPNNKAISYPEGKENMYSEFDKVINNENWDQLLNDIGLKEINDFKYNDKKHKFKAYRRAASISDAISAKVYFKVKRVCLFSASFQNFPNWHNRDSYPVWSLPPSFVLFYHLDRDWSLVEQHMQMIADSQGFELPVPLPTVHTDYPLRVLPPIIAQSIVEVAQARSLSIDFVASAGLWTISSLAGTRYQSDFNGDGKNILFIIMVAPVSAGKTPAFKSMCETPLKVAQEKLDLEYAKAIKQWDDAKAEAQTKKKAFKDKRPSRFIPIAVDGTTEGYIHKSMGQPNGIGVYQDEAETILNAGSFKSNNDAISFFTQAFSGGRVAQIRADETKERVVANLNLNLLMGTQPTRLKNIFTEDRLSSGFASRFIMVQADYQQLNTDSDPFGRRKEMCDEWVDIVVSLFHNGRQFNDGKLEPVKIKMDEEAKNIYRSYHKQLLTEANTRITTKAESYIIGTEAKMSAYFPRLVQILAILWNHNKPEITPQIVHDGYTLYRYYAESTIRIIHGLHTELDTGLPADLELLYQTLPDEFTLKEASDTCLKINMKPRRFEVSVRRKDFSQLFIKLTQGKYKKK